MGEIIEVPIIEPSKQLPIGIILDATTLTNLQVCEFKFDVRHNEQLVPNKGKSEALEGGTLVHAILEGYYKAKQLGLNEQECQIKGIQLGEQVFREGSLQDKEPIRNVSTDGWNNIIDTMEQYWKRWRNDSFSVLAVETVRGKLIYSDDEIRILWKAKQDLVIDTNVQIFPVDHKTMKQRRDNLLTNNQFIGLCLVNNVQTMLINKIGFQKTLKPEEKFVRPPMNYNKERFAEFIDNVVWFAKYMVTLSESGYYPTRYSQCETKFGKCDYYEDMCSANRSMRSENARLHFHKSSWDVLNDGDD